MKTEKPILGIDIGGTAVKLGLVNENGNVIAKTQQSVSFDGYKTPIMQTVNAAVYSFLEQMSTTTADLQGIAVSATGQIDSNTGTVAGTGGNFSGWIGTCVAKELKVNFNLPITVANDANCMCLGESWVGSGIGYKDIIGITVGTGIGGGILTGGVLLEGNCGLGGELGHIPTHATNGLQCGCGNTGCFEKYAATTALVKKAMEIDKSLSNGKIIFEQAQSGNKEVVCLLDNWISEIAIGLTGLVHVFNPQIIIVGGGVCSQQKLFIEPLAQKVKASVMPAFGKNLNVCAAKLGNDAGLVGAVKYFITHFEKRL